MNKTRVIFAVVCCLAVTSCFEDDAKKVERYKNQYLNDNAEYQGAKERCKNFSILEKEADLKCRALQKATSEMLLENYTDIGNPQPLKKRP